MQLLEEISFSRDRRLEIEAVHTPPSLTWITDNAWLSHPDLPHDTGARSIRSNHKSIATLRGFCSIRFGDGSEDEPVAI